jgi:HNH endonuclease/NUMOD4 motif
MPDDTPETWKPIPGYEGLYDYSTLGRIRSYYTRGPGGPCPILRPSVNPRDGHLYVTLYKNGTAKPWYVHRIVALGEYGPLPPGLETRHLDGDPANNRPGNLKYDTHQKNADDMVRHGRSIAGTRHPFTTLTDTDVMAIRQAWQQGTRGVDLAAQYGISTAAVCRIGKGETYRDGEILERARDACHYPECGELAEEGTNSQGMPKAFCADPWHTKTNAANRRKSLAKLAARPLINCDWCGEAFRARARNSKYCSRRCKTDAGNAATRERKSPRRSADPGTRNGQA